MAKEKDKIELRAVDEEAEKVARFVRLLPDAVEEVVELPPIRVGDRNSPEAKLLEAKREDLKIRSIEPDVSSLIERDEVDVLLEEDQWDARSAVAKDFPWGWLVLLGLLFAGGIVWSLVKVNRAEPLQGHLQNEAKIILEKDIEDGLDAELLITKIDDTVRAFLACGSVGEMSRYVRHPQRVVPMMEKYYRERPPAALPVERITRLDPLTIENRASFWLVSYMLEGGKVSQVLVDVITKDEIKVDWETFTCYQPIDWDLFARTLPEGHTDDFRVYAEPDKYYSYEFSDSDAFASFRLTALNGEEILNGYVARNTETETKIMEAFAQNGGKVTPMILRLQRPEGALSKRGVLVKEMVSARWIFVDDPEREKP